MVINDYEIKAKSLQNEEDNIIDENEQIIRENKYFIKDLYEAQFYKNIPFEDFNKKIKNDKLEIDYLTGNNGKIL